MRVRLATTAYRFEFDGPPGLWNEFFRPILGGPEAPPEAPAHGDTTNRSERGTGGSSFAPARTGMTSGAPAPSHGAFSKPTAVPAATVRRFVVPRDTAPHNDGYSGGAFHSDGGYERGNTSDRRPDGRNGPPRRGQTDGPRNSAGEPPKEWRRRSTSPEPTIQVEPSTDPNVLYQRLSDLDSRRAEKDAVLAAVWFVGRGARDVSPDEVDRHMRDHGGPEGVKVRPVMQKHITRTKLLEPGQPNGWVHLSPKGRVQVRLIVGE